jgi:hypothetical protein
MYRDLPTLLGSEKKLYSTFRNVVVAALLALVLGFGHGKVFGQNKAYCDLHGAVFVEASAAAAQYRVYEEKTEAFADLLVFKTQNALFADRGGLWFMTGTRASAALRVYFVAERSMADFSVYYTPTESFAGCR